MLPVTLIDEAVTAVERARAERRGAVMGEPIDLSPRHALVWAICLAAESAARGHGSTEVVDGAVRTARRAGIEQHEISAAIAVGERRAQP
jgi:hypothetical protein